MDVKFSNTLVHDTALFSLEEVHDGPPVGLHRVHPFDLIAGLSTDHVQEHGSKVPLG